MGNATTAGLGSEAPHDERDTRSVGGQNSDTRPYDIELAEEAKESKVINRKSNLDSEVPRSLAFSNIDHAAFLESYIPANCNCQRCPALGIGRRRGFNNVLLLVKFLGVYVHEAVDQI